MHHPLPLPSRSAASARWTHRFIAGCALAVLAGAAQADAFTLTGSFNRDDDVQLFSITLATAGVFDLRSLGYAGGTDTNGVTRGAGGFDTMAFLFSGAGALLAQSDDGFGAATDPATGLAADAGFSLSLAAGTYTVALTQYDNVPVGNLSAGFSRAGAGNFTPTLATGCTASRFCDWSGAARTGQWVLTFNGVSAVSPVPEPATWALMLGGAALLLARRRRAMH